MNTKIETLIQNIENDLAALKKELQVSKRITNQEEETEELLKIVRF